MAIAVFGVRALLPTDIPAAVTLAALACAGAATYAGVLLLAWPDVVRSGIAMLRRRPTSPMPPASGPVPVGQTSTIVD